MGQHSMVKVTGSLLRHGQSSALQIIENVLCFKSSRVVFLILIKKRKRFVSPCSRNSTPNVRFHPFREFRFSCNVETNGPLGGNTHNSGFSLIWSLGMLFWQLGLGIGTRSKQVLLQLMQCKLKPKLEIGPNENFLPNSKLFTFGIWK